ncbi:MAG: methyltransferase domain-containing protein [Chloroflexota bacterium]|nr:methyltransferase domain-containing protein [Chloroflexota bacterium]
MPYNGPQFYDDDALFAAYQQMRERPTNANLTLERPIFRALTRSVVGLRLLDLGCGDARFGREALLDGARHYVGLEASHNMAAAARTVLTDTGGEVVETSIEAWAYPEGAFDLVVSRLALHYIEDFDTVCTKVFASLVYGGRFVFSVEHPVLTCSQRGAHESGVHEDWIVDDYFVTGRRVKTWMGSEVVIYHRTVEDYVLGLQAAGFVLEALRESRPQPELFSDPALYARRLRIPLLLFCAGRKP